MRVVCQSLIAGGTLALNNGLCHRPPMGFNSYMSGVSGEAGLGAVAEFFVSSGMTNSGYEFVNTDEGWEMKERDNSTGKLRWDPKAYPSGLPTFISSLHAKGLKYGICESEPTSVQVHCPASVSVVPCLTHCSCPTYWRRRKFRC